MKPEQESPQSMFSFLGLEGETAECGSNARLGIRNKGSGSHQNHGFREFMCCGRKGKSEPGTGRTQSESE